LASAHLRSYTETTGDRLVFGRTLNAQILGLGDEDDLADVLDTVLGASLVANWSSQAVVSNLDIDANQLYRVTFNVNAEGGLPVGLLQNSSFGIQGVTGEFNQSATLLNVLNLVQVGAEDPSTGQFSFVFKSATDRNNLTFNFAANSLLNLSALGGATGNQEVLSFSNFEVIAVPEPSACLLAVASTGILLIRRRRVA
jgi:hypothetical protein